MAVFNSCYYALGTGVSNLSVFQEATSYTRAAVSLTGTALSGMTQAVSQITGPTGPVGGIITKGAIFDAVTNGNCLCYWDWTVLTAVPANFLAVTVNLVLNTYLQTALNLSLIGGQGASGSTIDPGAQIGTVNGNPLIAASRLGIQAGSLAAQNYRVMEVGVQGLLIQSNGINIAHIDAAGNLVVKGTVNASSATVGTANTP